MHDNKMPTSRLHDNKENTNLGLKGIKVTTDLLTKIIHSPAYDCHHFKHRLQTEVGGDSLVGAMCEWIIYSWWPSEQKNSPAQRGTSILDTVPEKVRGLALGDACVS